MLRKNCTKDKWNYRNKIIKKCNKINERKGARHCWSPHATSWLTDWQWLDMAARACVYCRAVPIRSLLTARWFANGRDKPKIQNTRAHKTEQRSQPQINSSTDRQTYSLWYAIKNREIITSKQQQWLVCMYASAELCDYNNKPATTELCIQKQQQVYIFDEKWRSAQPRQPSSVRNKKNKLYLLCALICFCYFTLWLGSAFVIIVVVVVLLPPLSLMSVSTHVWQYVVARSAWWLKQTLKRNCMDFSKKKNKIKLHKNWA